MTPVKNRYAVLIRFIQFFIAFSFVIRLFLLFNCGFRAELSFFSVLAIFSKGLIFDTGVALFFSTIYALYLLAIPSKWVKTAFNRVATYTIVFLMVLIAMFSFFAEVTFWQEFESRFNFIAVDYLIYTFEVINNINESYPLPILISGMVLISVAILFAFKKLGAFKDSEETKSPFPFKKRLLVSGLMIAAEALYILFIPNSWAETNQNHYQNELAKAGVYSFVAAFKNNELDFERFYPLLSNAQAFAIIRNELKTDSSVYLRTGESILRSVKHANSAVKPNVIMITIESFSADFMAHFGNTQHLTPYLDSLADESLLFTNMYATGTRTVRGMEALSLAVPPTPGNSIVRRPHNAGLTTIGEIFRQKGYQTAFFYGGDGYFDNMNQYFGSNGFDIIDRGKRITVGDSYATKRSTIPDTAVHFENAWGICDGDLYNAVIQDADLKFKNAQPFYDFVMTTSNHRPFTYPDGKIDIPSKSGRDGAVKYTDYAIGEFVRKIQRKPWFKNTVIVFVADHCASSAGKNEIDIAKYHIPCMVYHLKGCTHKKIEKLCSQIDIYPTFLSLLGWNYTSNLYGKDVQSKSYQPRAVLGTYQKLAYLDTNSLVVLSPPKRTETYLYDFKTNEQKVARISPAKVNKAIAYYQSAYLLYKRGGLKSAHAHKTHKHPSVM